MRNRPFGSSLAMLTLLVFSTLSGFWAAVVADQYVGMLFLSATGMFLSAIGFVLIEAQELAREFESVFQWLEQFRLTKALLFWVKAFLRVPSEQQVARLVGYGVGGCFIFFGIVMGMTNAARYHSVSFFGNFDTLGRDGPGHHGVEAGWRYLLEFLIPVAIGGMIMLGGWCFSQFTSYQYLRHLVTRRYLARGSQPRPK